MGHYGYESRMTGARPTSVSDMASIRDRHCVLLNHIPTELRRDEFHILTVVCKNVT